MAFLVDRPMPTACDECPCMYDYIQCTALKDNAKESLSAVNDYTIRQPWCPIEEVVRCKDCIKGTVLDKNYVKCNLYKAIHWPMFFCAHGETKDGEQE